VSLQDVDGLNRVFDIPSQIDRFYSLHRIDSHRREKIIVARSTRSPGQKVPKWGKKNNSDALSNNLARHRRLGNINQCIPSKGIHFDAQLLLHELDRLPTRQPITSDNRGRVDLGLDELVRAAQELRSDDDHRRRPIADLLVLLLCEIDEDFTGGMFDCEEREDGGAVVGNCYFLQ